MKPNLYCNGIGEGRQPIIYKSEFLKSANFLNPMEKVIEDTLNLISLPKDLVSGRNFSSVHDDMSIENLKQLHIIDKDFYKLRRNLNSANSKIE